MNHFLGIILLIGIVLLRIIPEISTLLIAFDMKCDSSHVHMKQSLRVKTFVISCGFNFIIYLLAHYLLLKRWNFIQTARNIVNYQFTYRNIDYLAISLMICILFSVSFGFLFRGSLKKILCLRYPVKGLSKRTKHVLGVLLAVISLVVIECFYLSFSGQQNVVINEVSSNNRNVVLDENGSISDYIELYNKGSLACDTYQLYLSDDIDDLKKKEIASEIIPAKGYCVVPLNDEVLALNKNGEETLYLSDSTGNILDEIMLVEMEKDVSYVRCVDGDGQWEIKTCSPGVTNAVSATPVKAPVLSVEPGFYDEEFYLEIFSEEGTEIYYTLDGSDPTKEAVLYDQPVLVYDKSNEENKYRSIKNVTRDWKQNELGVEPVDKGFVIRAAAVNEEGQFSDIVTGTYFINMNAYKQNTVLSIVADPEDLFGDNGIYVTGQEYDEWYLSGQNGESPLPNFMKKGKEYEVSASLEMMSEEYYLNQPSGIRVFGSSSREIAMKRLSVYSRKEYSDSSSFNMELFEGVHTHSFLLRRGYANSFTQHLMTGRNTAVQDSYPVVVFLNGEYWYDTIILEKYDTLYFSEYYNIDKENIIVVKDGEISEGSQEDIVLYHNLFEYVKSHDLSEDQFYEECSERMDIQSYIDFMCFNIYIQNMDYGDTKNTIMYRAREDRGGTYDDGKWRWALYDLDCVDWMDQELYGVDALYKVNTFSAQPRFVNVPINKQAIYVALKNNKEFCKQFVLTFMDLVNTSFSMDTVMEQMNEFGDYSEYMVEFFENRPNYIVPYLAEEFGLKGSLMPVTVTVNDAEGGYITLNTITPDLKNNTWSGNYFTDYPIEVTAVAKEGYRFAGWSGSVSSGENCLQVQVEEGGITLYAVFEKQSE